MCVCVLAAKWFFHTCGATGSVGPTPSQCSSSYRNINVNVTVGTTGALKGIQMWRVPETGLYRYASLGKKLERPYIYAYKSEVCDPCNFKHFFLCVSFLFFAISLLRLDMYVFIWDLT